MAESARFKDLTAKMDKMLAVMDQHDERIKLLEQSLATISQYIESHQAQSSNNTMQPPSQPVSDLASPLDPRTVIPLQLDFPRFDGSDALHWIFRAEQFFDLYDISDPYRVKIAAIHIEGEVIPWFQMLQKSGELVSWSSLTKAVEAAYVSSVFERPSYALFKLQQQDTVSNYYSSFTALASRVEGLSSAALLDCFVSGLKRDIQRDVIPWQPESRTKAVSLATLFEEKYQRHAQGFVKNPFSTDDGSSIKHLPPLGSPDKSLLPQLPPVNTPSNISANPRPSVAGPQPVKRISFNEMQFWTAKGLCFNCDEKYSPQHICANEHKPSFNSRTP